VGAVNDGDAWRFRIGLVQSLCEARRHEIADHQHPHSVVELLNDGCGRLGRRRGNGRRPPRLAALGGSAHGWLLPWRNGSTRRGRQCLARGRPAEQTLEKGLPANELLSFGLPAAPCENGGKSYEKGAYGVRAEPPSRLPLALSRRHPYFSPELAQFRTPFRPELRKT